MSADNDARRYGAIVEWLAENNPRALELCPYKIDGTTVVRPSEPLAGSQAGLSGPSGSPTSHRPDGGESVSREAQAVEQREADASAAPVPTSPSYRIEVAARVA